MEVVLELVEQIMEGFGRENIEFFHIGADEVFNIAKCQKCQLFANETSVHTLFARYIRKLLKRLDKKYNQDINGSGGMKPI